MRKNRMIIIFAVVAVLAAAGIIGFLKYNAYKTEKDAEERLKQTEESQETEIETEEHETASEYETESETEAETESETEYKNGKKVAIDPGHQGWNIDMSAKEPLGPGSSEMKAKATSGTSGRFTGVPEYELVLNISKQLKTVLEERGYEVILTREDNDTAISNKERAILASESGADVYVRIHANGSEDSSANGAMTMIPSASNPYVGHMHEDCKALGQAIIDAYCAATGMKNNGVQLFDNMSGINWSTIPVTIIEMGFMTNETDDVNMSDAQYQAKMVRGIADGIDDYFGLSDGAEGDAQSGHGAQESADGLGQADTKYTAGNNSGKNLDNVSGKISQDDMKQAIQQYIQTNTYSGEVWSVCAQTCDGSASFSINEQQMQAASLIKLYIMAAVYENYDTVINANGQSKVDQLLYAMITVSDNDAANSLTKMLGDGDAAAGRSVVNAFCENHGYSRSSMGRMLLEVNPSGENYTSVGDCTKFLSDVYQGQLSYSDSMLTLLKQQQRTGKIPAGVPADVETANKTGELSNVENDAAIIFGEEETYILCVMSAKLSSTSNARSVITEISSEVYEYFNKN